MKIVFLDAFTTNPGDVDYGPLSSLGALEVYDRSSSEEAIERAKTAEVIIVNKFILDEIFLAASPSLKYIVVAATGYNNIDIDAVRKRNIPVSNVRSYSTTSVVQQVFASLLGVLNRPAHYMQEVKNGRWQASPDFCFYDHSIRELSGMIMGIVGFGQIGSSLAEVALAFGMEVRAFHRHAIHHKGVVRVNSIEDLFSSCDVISLHVPLAAETSQWVNKDKLSLMKEGSILINTGRGGLIDETALAQHLSQNPKNAAILDVLTAEPPKSGNCLVGLPNCYITPHIAWASAKARQNLIQGIVDNIGAYKNGQWINRVY
ncbi:MAG: D-2-hydroxyacid dehydrogenase [Saprospiraceae bacterium]|nr:D-2-hydroxyacid dehydrogenase [Saprospiraceae bacterium]